MGRLHGVTVDIEGVSAPDNFEVKNIFDDSNLYPTLLGINWAIDMNEVINLKKKKISFDRKLLWVVVWLEPAEGLRYTELVRNYEESDDDLYQIYKIITRDQESINLMADGRIAWDQECSCTSNLDEYLKHL